jgi:hypothetical protein
MSKLGVWEKLSDVTSEAVLVENGDYDAGDPDLSLMRHVDGKYEFVIYRGTQDLSVHDLTAKQVREVARRILDLVPDEGA